MKGFSILEILITIAIFSILFAMGTPFLTNFTSKNTVDSSVQEYSTILERARILAVSRVEDTDWSVIVDDGDVVIFSGDDFAGRDSDLDERYQLAGKLEISTTTDYVTFNRTTGFSDAISTTTFRVSGSAVDIVVNEDGSVLIN